MFCVPTTNDKVRISSIDFSYTSKPKFFSKSKEALEARKAREGIVYWTQTEDKWLTVQADF